MRTACSLSAVVSIVLFAVEGLFPNRFRPDDPTRAQKDTPWTRSTAINNIQLTSYYLTCCSGVVRCSSSRVRFRGKENPKLQPLDLLLFFFSSALQLQAAAPALTPAYRIRQLARRQLDWKQQHTGTLAPEGRANYVSISPNW
jgi:hypothetical protein